MIRIITDSTADLWQEYVEKRNLYVITMNYRLGDNNYMATPDTASPLYMDDREFYRQMRAGVIASTSRHTRTTLSSFFMTVTPFI